MKFVLSLILFSIVGSMNLVAKDLAARGSLSAAQAQNEIEHVHQRIVRVHPNPYWFNGPEVWAQKLAELRTRKGRVSAVDHYFDLASLLSLAMDTHVQVYPNADTPGFERSYPLRFRLFSEGVYVSAGADAYRDWVGLRLVSVDRKPVGQLIEVLSKFAFSDHPIRQRSWAVENLLPHPATYQNLDLTGEDGGVAVRLERPDGTQFDAELGQTVGTSFDEFLSSGTSTGYYWPPEWKTLDDLIPADAPMSRANLDRHYWRSDLEDGSTVYLQLNSPSDQPGRESLFNFLLNSFADIANREVRPSRLILDLRHDLGGSIGRSLPLAYLARASGICCDPGSVVLLVGRETISAGSVLAGAIEIATHAIVIGEPSGGRPNLFLGHDSVSLPYSRLAPEVSTESYIGTDSQDVRLYVAPDIVVEESFAALMGGRDLALERALSLKPEEVGIYYSGAAELMPWNRPSQQGAIRRDVSGNSLPTVIAEGFNSAQ